MRVLFLVLILLFPVISFAQTPVIPDPFGPGNLVIWSILQNSVMNSAQTLMTTNAYPSGAISQQTLALQVNGYALWRITDPHQDVIFSLGNAAGGCCVGGYALHLANGVVIVRENGWIKKASAPVNSGDNVGIAINSGLLWYFVNGKTLYFSSLAAGTPLKVFVQFQSFNSSITSVYVSPTFQ